MSGICKVCGAETVPACSPCFLCEDEAAGMLADANPHMSDEAIDTCRDSAYVEGMTLEQWVEAAQGLV